MTIDFSYQEKKQQQNNLDCHLQMADCKIVILVMYMI